MAAVLTTYTSYDQVRATLGVTSEEISDTTLGLALYAESLLIELEEVASALPADFAIVAAITAGSRTDAENKFYAAVGLFSAFAVAAQLGTSLPLFSPKSVTDGKAAFARDANSPYKETLKGVQKSYERFRSLLASRYATYKSTATTAVVLPFLSVISPSLDPVVG